MMIATIIVIWCVCIITLIAGVRLIQEMNKQEDQILDLQNRISLMAGEMRETDRAIVRLKADMGESDE